MGQVLSPLDVQACSTKHLPAVPNFETGLHDGDAEINFFDCDTSGNTDRQYPAAAGCELAFRVDPIGAEHMD